MPYSLPVEPLVSVIIPAYNQGPMLAHAIESALGQTYPRVEIVVVNDGSPSPVTRETAERYTGRIVYVERVNGGVAAARNTGIQASTGDLVAFLDQDDAWLPGKLAAQVRALVSHPGAALVHSSYYIVDEEGQRTGVARLPEGEWHPLASLLVDNAVNACTAVFPRAVLREAGPLDETLAGADDWDLWLRVALTGRPFYCVPEPLAEYRVHAGNTSRDLDLMVNSALRVLRKFYSHECLPPEARRVKRRALGSRHAWAAVAYYGAGRLRSAAEHLREAARLDPSSVTSGRFLTSLVTVRHGPPQAGGAKEAIGFALHTLAAGPLPGGLQKRVRSRAWLVLALHSTGLSPAKRALLLMRGLSADPGLALDPEIWIAAWRKLLALEGHSTAGCVVERL